MKKVWIGHWERYENLLNAMNLGQIWRNCTSASCSSRTLTLKTLNTKMQILSHFGLIEKTPGRVVKFFCTNWSLRRIFNGCWGWSRLNIIFIDWSQTIGFMNKSKIFNVNLSIGNPKKYQNLASSYAKSSPGWKFFSVNSGFIINAVGGASDTYNPNSSGVSYIFYAIA